MTDNSDPTKLEPQEPQAATQAATVATYYPDTTPSPVATPPVVTSAVPPVPAVVDSAPDTTIRIAPSNVTPMAPELPQRDTVIDPRVTALRAMFPDYDDIILCVRSTRYPPNNPLPTHIVI